MCSLGERDSTLVGPEEEHRLDQQVDIYSHRLHCPRTSHRASMFNLHATYITPGDVLTWMDVSVSFTVMLCCANDLETRLNVHMAASKVINVEVRIG